jgi:hypothetical protein
VCPKEIWNKCGKTETPFAASVIYITAIFTNHLYGTNDEGLLPLVPFVEAPMRSRKAPRSLDRKGPRVSRTPKNAKSTRAPYDLASLFRGLYHRVARRLGRDPSYVSRVARRERRSKIIEDALRCELGKIMENISKRRGSIVRKAARKKAPKRAAKKAGRKRM